MGHIVSVLRMLGRWPHVQQERRGKEGLGIVYSSFCTGLYISKRSSRHQRSLKRRDIQSHCRACGGLGAVITREVSVYVLRPAQPCGTMGIRSAIPSAIQVSERPIIGQPLNSIDALLSSPCQAFPAGGNQTETRWRLFDASLSSGRKLSVSAPGPVLL